jgi:putative FmdB family regulatory protein
VLAALEGGSLPTYQYACTECGEQSEVIQKFSDDPLTVCSMCGGRLRKVFSPVGIVFKGSGFYRNDSRASANGTKPNGSHGSSETSSESKTADSKQGDSGGTAKSGEGESTSAEKKSGDGKPGDGKSGNGKSGNGKSSSSSAAKVA